MSKQFILLIIINKIVVVKRFQR